MSNVVFVDIETTGLDPDYHEPWEVGLIDSDGKEHRWFLPVDLGRADKRALDIGDYYGRHPMAKGSWLQSAITDRDVFCKEFERLTRGKHLCGAVISFDEERLRKLLKANGACPGWHYHLVDVEAMVAGKFAVPPPWDSEELSRMVGVNPEDFNRHTALGDARWAKAIYEAIMG